MPVFVRLISSQTPIAHRVLDTKCVTEEASYQFTKVFAPSCALTDLMSAARQHINMASTDLLFLCMGGVASWAAAVADKLLFAEPGLDAAEALVSVGELRDDELVDAFEPSVRLKVEQEEAFAYTIHGWSSNSLAQGHGVLASPAPAPRVLQFKCNERTATVIELPQTRDADAILRSLLELVILTARSDGQHGGYFPYRDSVVSKLVWQTLLWAPSALNVFISCSLDVADAARSKALLHLGDRLFFLMAQSTKKQRSLLPKGPTTAGTSLHEEAEQLIKLVRRLKQLRADANAAEYAKRKATKNERAAALKLKTETKLRTLEAWLESLSSERERKERLLEHKKHQCENRRSSDSQEPPKHLNSDVETAAATLRTLQNQLAAKKSALASALALTADERKRGNVAQVEHNLKVLHGQWKALAQSRGRGSRDYV